MFELVDIITLFKEKFMFSDAFADKRLDIVTLFKEKFMFSDAFADAFGTFRHIYSVKGKINVFRCFC